MGWAAWEGWRTTDARLVTHFDADAETQKPKRRRRGMKCRARVYAAKEAVPTATD